MSVLGERIFSFEDQLWFSAASGDANPIHIDPEWAQANFPGEIVVHGVHALLWALELALRAVLVTGIEKLTADFVRPIAIGDSVVLESAEDGALLRLSVRGEVMAVIRIAQGSSQWAVLDSVAAAPPQLASPRERTLADLVGLYGVLGGSADHDVLAGQFPSAAKVVGVRALAGIARLSTLIGMECPGLRSMFSQLAISAAPTAQGTLRYRVNRTNTNFSRAEIAVEGEGLTGVLSAYVGREFKEPSNEDIQSLVASDAFCGARPLVIGGSGGLGAITARLLAAGGAVPVIGWHQNHPAIERVRDSIVAAGGRCEVVRFSMYDIEAGLADLNALGWNGRQVYYFATPRIFRRHMGLYDPSALRLFLEAYADGFFRIAEALRERQHGGELTLFYPSSVAVSEPTGDLLEYGIAKAAGERICTQLNLRYPDLHLVVARLPRIQTRQTQSFVIQEAEAGHRAMLPFVLEVQCSSKRS